MPTYVFSLGLIPVQEWIAQARRSRDLRAGSVFRGHVMTGILARLQRELAADVRLPAPPPGDLQPARSFGAALQTGDGIPNRASGYCEAADDGAVSDWFGRLEPELVVGVWRELRDRFLKLDGLQEEVRGALEPHLAAYLRRIPAEADCPLSLVWVARQAAHPRADLAATC